MVREIDFDKVVFVGVDVSEEVSCFEDKAVIINPVIGRFASSSTFRSNLNTSVSNKITS